MNEHNKTIEQLKKLTQILGFLFWLPIWFEVIIIFFPKLKSVGRVLNQAYGSDGLASYLGVFLIMSIFFFWLNKKISSLEKLY